MAMKVYKFGALPIDDPALREQMKRGNDYYNALVAAENARRKEIWGGDLPPPAPHPGCSCKDCRDHFSALNKAVKATFLDLKPHRKVAAEAGLYFGTYLLIERAFDMSKKKTKSTSLLRFRSWRKGVVAGVQVAKSYQARGSTGSLYRLERKDERTGRRARGGRGRHLLEIRIGSGPKRAPIFSQPIPIEVHRPIEGSVAWVSVHKKMRGEREVWHVCFTSSGEFPREEPAPGEVAEGGGAIVAIDVSWRKIDDELRLAYARGDDGKIFDFRLGEKWLRHAKKAEDLASIRMKNLNELAKLEPAYAKYQAARRARQAIFAAEKPPEEGAEPVAPPSEAAVAFAKQDLHLEEWEQGCLARSVHARRDAIRKWLRMLRSQYGILVVKDTNFAELKKLKKESGEDLPQPARRQGKHAAPGEIIEWARYLWKDMSVVASPNTTRTCHACGYVNEGTAARVIHCQHCGEAIDVDDQSTRNMLKAYAESMTSPPSKRKSSAKWAKRHKPSVGAAEVQC